MKPQANRSSTAMMKGQKVAQSRRDWSRAAFRYMSRRPLASSHGVTGLLLAACASFACGQTTAPTPRALPKPELKVFTSTPKPIVDPATAWTPTMSPADFLDGIGTRVKARWRQLYRPPPPAPATERRHAAFALGALIADSFLASQATDAQQFRNTGQDLTAHCRVLGIGEKMSPRLMSQGKLAEQEKWPELRQDVVNGHQQVVQTLRDNRDEDLAVLIDIGLWLRMIEIASTMVSQAPETNASPLCIGSAALAVDLRARYAQLTARTQADERIAWIAEFIDYLQRFVGPGVEASPESAAKVLEKVTSLMTKVALR